MEKFIKSIEGAEKLIENSEAILGGFTDFLDEAEEKLTGEEKKAVKEVRNLVNRGLAKSKAGGNADEVLAKLKELSEKFKKS